MSTTLEDYSEREKRYGTRYSGPIDQVGAPTVNNVLRHHKKSEELRNSKSKTILYSGVLIKVLRNYSHFIISCSALPRVVRGDSAAITAVHVHIHADADACTRAITYLTWVKAVEAIPEHHPGIAVEVVLGGHHRNGGREASSDGAPKLFKVAILSVLILTTLENLQGHLGEA